MRIPGVRGGCERLNLRALQFQRFTRIFNVEPFLVWSSRAGTGRSTVAARRRFVGGLSSPALTSLKPVT